MKANKLKVIVTRPFYDMVAETDRKPGDIFTTSEMRFNQINSTKDGLFVDVLKEPEPESEPEPVEEAAEEEPELDEEPETDQEPAVEESEPKKRSRSKSKSE